MNNRMLSMLGLCARAGRLITGEKACLQSIRAGSACAAVLDSRAADNAVKAMTDACASHGVPLARTGAFELGGAIGKPSRMAAVITDARLAARVMEFSGSTESTINKDTYMAGEARAVPTED